MKLYSNTHEWFDTETNEVGITNHAAEELGDIVYIELPNVESEVTFGVAFTELESVKAVAEIYSPVTGIVCDENLNVEQNPALINDDAENCWIIKVKDARDFEGLMTKEEYDEYIKNEVN